MKPILIYVYAGERYLDAAARFVSCYNAFPAGADHDCTIVCNNCEPDGFVRSLFGSLANVGFLKHDNSGYDIGAFQLASSIQQPRIALFLGATAFMQRGGWMKRVVDSAGRRGLGVYGAMGNRGVDHGGVHPRVWPHIRTTGFWLSTELMNRYPLKVTQPHHRYAFEHGQGCLSQWAGQQGYPSWVVTWDMEYPEQSWDLIENGFHRGDQSNLIFKDRLCEPPYYG